MFQEFINRLIIYGKGKRKNVKPYKIMCDKKTEEFLQKLAPCVERGELDGCVEEAARLAGEMEIWLS